MIGRHAFLMSRQKVHGHEPLYQWYLGVMKKSAKCGREVVQAMRTAIFAILAALTVMLFAIRTYDVTVGPTLLGDKPLTGFSIGEGLHNGNEAVEFVKRNVDWRYVDFWGHSSK